jgi:DNA-binding NtrC family response regulator
VLVVEDDPDLCQEVAALARDWGVEASEATSLEQAVALLDRRPDVVIADLWLAGASAIPLLERMVHRHPAPAVVAMSGQATPVETFRLGRLNVRAFLPKPFTAEDLRCAVERAISEPPDVMPWLSDLVGHMPLRSAQEATRGTMLDEALARTDNSRSGAARILRVSRQAIQQVMQRQRRGRRAPARALASDGSRPPAAR